MFENIFETVNAGFAQALYEDYLRDPSSVPQAWRTIFENGLRGEQPVAAPSAPRSGDEGAVPTPVQPSQLAKADTGSGSVEPLKGSALRLLQNMEASLGVPTATSFRDVEASFLWDVRKGFNDQLKARQLKLSFTHLIGWAIVLAAKAFPSMVRAVVDVEGQPHRFDPGAVHLGLAVDVERKDGTRSLMVPVIKGAYRIQTNPDGYSQLQYQLLQW